MESEVQSITPKELSNAISSQAPAVDQVADHNAGAVAANGLNGLNGIKSAPADETNGALTLPTPEDQDATLPPIEADVPVQQPVSELRSTTKPSTEAKPNGTSQAGDAKAAASSTSHLTSDFGDAMNIDQPEADAKPAAAEPASLQMPHHPAKDEPMPDAPSDPPLDSSEAIQPSVEESGAGISGEVNATDATDPARSQAKVSRPRDDDPSEMEPASKRVRAEDSASAPATQPALPSATSESFTMPDAPAGDSATQTSAAPAAAGAQDVKLLPPPPEREHNADYDLPMTKPQLKHLSRGIINAKKSAHAPPFNQPVDPVALNIPNYFDIVKKPMDLKTIDNKLKQESYLTVSEFIQDFDLMVSNTVRFNGPDHFVSQHAFHLRNAVDRNLASLPGRDYTEPTPAEKKAKKAATPKPPQRRESRSSLGNAKSPTAAGQTFALGPSGIPLIRRDSTVADGRPRREIHPPAPKDLPYSASKPKRKKFQLELKFCEEVLNEMKKPKYTPISWAFQQPVDPVALNIPTYHKIIKKPMDISTIEKKLHAGQYENAKEFEQDVRLMFNNCYKFNPPEHAVHKNGKDFEELFNERWAGKAKWLSDRAPSSGAQSPGSSPEPDEEDEEEEEPEEEDDSSADKIAELQKSIEAMSKQVAALQQKKKASPPAAKQKGKANKASKKESKKGSQKNTKKTSRRKEERVPHISYEEKMSLSDRINELDGNQMQVAVTIIRNAMPRLGGLNDDEVELDIDELPPEVLYKLNQFVKKHSAKQEEKTHTSAAAAATTAAVIPTQSSRPKKNKPMSKTEQEAKIQELRGKLSGLDRKSGGGGDSPGDSSQALANEDTSGDEDSEESEED